MKTDEPFDRRLVAIMAADIVGFSRLMEQDEEGIIRRQAEIMAGPFKDCIATGQGRIIKTTGDGALVEFASAVSAVRWPFRNICQYRNPVGQRCFGYGVVSDSIWAM